MNKTVKNLMLSAMFMAIGMVVFIDEMLFKHGLGIKTRYLI